MGHSHSHDDSHSHDHDHSGIFHSHAPAGKMKQAFFLAMIILAAELVFGILSNSLALLADAWHGHGCRGDWSLVVCIGSSPKAA